MSEKIISLTKRVPVILDGKETKMHPNVARDLFYKGRVSYVNKEDEKDDTHVSDAVLNKAGKPAKAK